MVSDLGDAVLMGLLLSYGEELVAAADEQIGTCCDSSVKDLTA